MPEPMPMTGVRLSPDFEPIAIMLVSSAVSTWIKNWPALLRILLTDFSVNLEIPSNNVAHCSF